MSEAGKTESSTLPARFSGHRLAVLAGAGLVVVSVAYIAVHWDSFAQGPVVQATGIWDQLLGTQEVAIAIRLAIVAGAVYVVASVVGLILQGRWLTKIRGAEVDPASSAEKRSKGSNPWMHGRRASRRPWRRCDPSSHHSSRSASGLPTG